MLLGKTEFFHLILKQKMLDLYCNYYFWDMSLGEKEKL